MGLQVALAGNDPSGRERAFLLDDAIRTILYSIISSEYQRLRGSPFSPLFLSDDIFLHENGIGFDSLALLEVVSTVCRFFELHVSGIEDYLFLERRVGGWIELLSEHFKQLERRGLDAHLVFSTSGSMGAPKPIRHPLLNLIQEVDAVLASGLLPQSIGRVLSLVPVHHIYGCIFSAILPSRIGCAAVQLGAINPARALRECRGDDLLVATPFIWGLLAPDTRLANLGGGVTSGAPMSVDLWGQLSANGLKSLTEVYGSSETAGVGLRNAATAPFTLMEHLSEREGAIFKNCDALDVQDNLKWLNKENFTVDGRKDHAVQIGGMNVSCKLVCEVLMQVDEVEDVAVRLDGERLKAFVQTQSKNRGELERRIFSHAMLYLEPVARPQKFSFGTILPRTNEGKMSDW